MRMLSGENLQRNFSLSVPDPPTPWTGADATRDALRQKAIGFNCLDAGGVADVQLTERHTLPDKSFIDARCQGGMRLEIAFPPCWNGRDLDSPDHRSHVAFASSGTNGGTCPPGFDTAIVQLVFETFYPVYNYRSRQGRFVLSNGDPTGSGYHGDAFIAWEPGVQAAGAAQCGGATQPGQPGYDGDPAKCSAFQLQSDDVQTQCHLDRTADAAAGVARTARLSQLPGDNPVRSGPEPAPAPAAGSLPASGAEASVATTLSRMPVATPSPAP